VSSFPPASARRPSSWWLVLAGICVLLTGASAITAIAIQRSASEPIGEGEVFIADAEEAEQLIASDPDPQSAVRRVRNALGIEAVSLVDGTGVVLASTSDPLTGSRVQNQLMALGAVDHRFMAVATAVETGIWLDGVLEWPVGSVLYQVVSPLDDQEESILLHYDVSQLLGRRAQPGTLRPEATQLLGLATIFGAIGAAILVGHSRAARRYGEVAAESQLLRSHSRELQEANEGLDRARFQAEEALRLAEEKIRIRSEFVLMINHELRTPLTSVVTGAELLRSTELSETDRSVVLDSMVSDGARLQEIIDQILAVARIENRGLSYELTEVSIDEVRNALTAVHQASVVPESAETHLEVMVRTDLGALGMVVASLVDNALTHGAKSVSIGCTNESRIVPQLEVGLRPHTAAFITISDDGPGIDPEFLPRIFEKFEKSSFSSGTGLGLYMARMIIEALEGSLAVESSASGCIFQISIPTVAVGEKVGVGA